MPASYMETQRRLFSDIALPMRTSMLHDIERNGPVEADRIAGFMLERARAHGLDDTLHRVSYIHLKDYEENRAAQHPAG
ncbi:MAG: ketopantoate reductase C-terminal domain-containing protein [Hyphomicrobiaceae bacterium]